MHIHSRIPQVVILLFVAVALQGCKETCPAYSTDIVGVMPIKRAGQTLCFISGTDTVRLEYGQVSFSKKYQQDHSCKCVCRADAELMATQKGSDGVIRYINWVTSFPDQTPNENGFFIILIHNVFDLTIEWALDLSTSTDVITQPSEYYNIEILADFTSEMGLKYENVYKITVPHIKPNDVLYMVRGIGLVQIESHSGKIWSLME